MLLRSAIFVVCLAALYRSVEGHGRLIDPPNRSSVWRYKSNPLIKPYQSIVVSNYDDAQLFCGGAQHQQSLGGLCGVCGDDYEDPNPENVPPGPYAKGIIVEQYAEGAWMPVQVELTTHHKGYFEFRLCPWNDVTTPVTHECLNQHLLYVGVIGTTQYNVNEESIAEIFHMEVKLPDGVTCDQCVLQWKYHTGNSWGCDADANCGLGLGPQEEFYGCADIAVGTDPILPPPGFREDDNVTYISPTSSAGVSSATTSSTSTISTTQSSAPTPTTTTTTESSNGNGACSGTPNGYVKIDCYSYYRCVNYESYQFNCSPGTKYDETSNVCKHEDQVDCS